jgi:chain length determinant protein (polysaccharide antigen chain regulator)
MTSVKDESIKSENIENQHSQAIFYGYMAQQPGDEVDLVELFTRIAKQWKLIVGITLIGTILALAIALRAPKIYEPTISITVPSIGDVIRLNSIDTVINPEFVDVEKYSSLGKPVDDVVKLLFLNIRSEIIPSSPQSVFNEYYDLFRSEEVWAEYVHSRKKISEKSENTNYGKNLVPVPADFNAVITTTVEETDSGKNGNNEEHPKLVSASLKVENEEIGVELLNDYPDYVNQKLMSKLLRDTKDVIKNRIEELNMTIARIRDEYKLKRGLIIQKKEQENAIRIAQLEQEISALLGRAKENDVKKWQGPSKINSLKEQITFIQSDPELVALKKRKTDDPWIPELPKLLSELSAIESFSPNYSGLIAYNINKSAVVTNQSINIKSAFIIGAGILTGLFISILISLFISHVRESQ